MENLKVDSLITECKQIKDDSEQNAETHHIIGHKESAKAFFLKIIPASITVLSAAMLLIEFKNWVDKDWLPWVTLVSGLVTVFNVLIGCEANAQKHFFAAKKYTVLKHKARSLHESFKDFMDEREFYHQVQLLREEYNTLVQFTPPTDDEKAYEKASQRIRKGVHKSNRKDEA